MTYDGLELLETQWQQNCYDQTSCKLELNITSFDDNCINRVDYLAAGSKYSTYAYSKGYDLFYQRDARRREPVFFAVAFCIADKLYSPTSGEELDMPKSDLGYLILVIDMLIVFITIFMINLFFRRFQHYSKIFDKKSVEMRDFTVCFKNHVPESVYHGKDIVFQAEVSRHFETVIKQQFVKNHLEDPQTLQFLEDTQPWQVIDVNFGKSETTEEDILTQINLWWRTRKRLIVNKRKMEKEE